MKKAILALLVGAFVGFILPASGQNEQRGDPYSTEAGQWMEQAFNPSGVIVYPNFTAAPYTCAAGFYGGYYYNTTSNLAFVCSSAGWVAAGVTIGTANTIVKFNAGATDLADSQLVDDATDITSTATAFLFGAGSATDP